MLMKYDEFGKSNVTSTAFIGLHRTFLGSGTYGSTLNCGDFVSVQRHGGNMSVFNNRETNPLDIAMGDHRYNV